MQDNFITCDYLYGFKMTDRYSIGKIQSSNDYSVTSECRKALGRLANKSFKHVHNNAIIASEAFYELIMKRQGWKKLGFEMHVSLIEENNNV